MYPIQHLKEDFSAASSASSSSKTCWGRWGCRGRPPGQLLGGNFEKKKFSLFFWFFLIKKKKNKRLFWGIKGAMIVSFLKQVLKLFWDNWKWAVLSHLLEKCCTFLHFLSNCWYGVSFFFYCLLQIEFRSQLISEYWNRTTTLIPFLRAIWHLCNFIHSYFMDRFTFLI